MHTLESKLVTCTRTRRGRWRKALPSQLAYL
ncbi:hypothetical protein QN277_013939 [Acacia crassicarpa]|uniref:Uncharacterized protein n=1 Tax=Acacia crassicarpa TaxID=499986 RepID=A0AAE1N3H3_9FABA|nr:hypothetical protein QN277_013939 [Acacia crassicarpa]